MKTLDRSTQASTRTGRWLGVALACALATAACSRVAADRTENQALAHAAKAIERYSVASEQANASHRAVMIAFSKANSATNLADYKALLRTDVLPALDTFVAKLAAMPTDTAELKAIHGKLVEAYRSARDRVADFERDLQDPSGLGKFDEIRSELQRAVGEYKKALDQYYAKNKRQLRFDGRAPADAVAPAAAASGTAAPAPATATSP